MIQVSAKMSASCCCWVGLVESGSEKLTFCFVLFFFL